MRAITDSEAKVKRTVDIVYHAIRTEQFHSNSLLSRLTRHVSFEILPALSFGLILTCLLGVNVEQWVIQGMRGSVLFKSKNYYGFAVQSLDLMLLPLLGFLSLAYNAVCRTLSASSMTPELFHAADPAATLQTIGSFCFVSMMKFNRYATDDYAPKYSYAVDVGCY